MTCKDCIHYKVCKAFNSNIPEDFEGITSKCDCFMNTADVAPMSEVARLQGQVNRLKRYDAERDIALHARLIAETREKVSREIIAYLKQFEGYAQIAAEELEKEYAEGDSGNK